MDKVKICDAIMGSGKSSAAINYMNSHPEKRFLYIAPYLDEVKRVKGACKGIGMVEPNKTFPDFSLSKSKHIIELLKTGRNIASTHAIFLRYTDEMLDAIKGQGYTIIIDEVVDVLRVSDICVSDIKLLDAAGWIKREKGCLKICPTFEYSRGALKEVISLSKGNRLIDIDDFEQGRDSLYYWIFSEEIFKAFEDVIVLTYMFEAQTMRYYFNMVDIPYEYIGIHHEENGEYMFSEQPEYIPDYAKNLSKYIHIFENDKLNAIGDSQHALSANWYKYDKGIINEGKDRLKKNVTNFFTNYHRKSTVNDRVWAVYKDSETDLRGAGYFYNNIPFNLRATNEYKGRSVLAYLVNIFMNPNEKIYLQGRGIDVLEDRWALSIMVQWIWRSAIREGKEIWIYVPSKRMRTLLTNWLSEVEQSYIAAYGQTEEVA